MNNTEALAAAVVTATAPDGQVFTHSALLRGYYTTRQALLVRTGDTWKALSWHVDWFAAHRKMTSKKIREAYDERIIVDVV